MQAAAALRPECVRALKACRASTPSVGEMFAEFKRPPVSLGKTPNARYLVLYQACVAFAHQDPDRCSALGDVYGTMRLRNADRKPYDVICREYDDDAQLVKAILTGAPQAEEMCRSRPPDPRLRAGALDTICSRLLKPHSDPAAFAEAVRPLFKSPPSAADLLHYSNGLRQLVGDSASCGEMERYNSERDTCAEFAAYHKALAARDASLCGSHGLCAAMMGGGPSACDAYLPTLQDLIYCPLWSDRQVAASHPDEDRTESCLIEALALAGKPPEPLGYHPAFSPHCTDSLSVRGLVADIGEGWFGYPPEVWKAVGSSVLAYYQAAAAIDPSRCTELARLRGVGGRYVMDECRERWASAARRASRGDIAALERRMRTSLCVLQAGKTGPLLPPK